MHEPRWCFAYLKVLLLKFVVVASIVVNETTIPLFTKWESLKLFESLFSLVCIVLEADTG